MPPDATSGPEKRSAATVGAGGFEMVGGLEVKRHDGGLFGFLELQRGVAPCATTGLAEAPPDGEFEGEQGGESSHVVGAVEDQVAGGGEQRGGEAGAQHERPGRFFAG